MDIGCRWSLRSTAVVLDVHVDAIALGLSRTVSWRIVRQRSLFQQFDFQRENRANALAGHLSDSRRHRFDLAGDVFMKHFAVLKQIPVLLFVALLIIDVTVLILEKVGANAAGTAVGDELGFTLRLAHNPSVWGVAVLSLLQLFVWNRILRQTDLSVAYPISSLFFPLTMLCSVLLFQEHVTWLAWTGGVLITLGVGCFSLDHGGISEQVEPKLSPVHAD